MSCVVGVFSAQLLNAASSYKLPVAPNKDGDLIVIAWQRMANNANVHPTATGFSNSVSTNNGWSSSGFIYKRNVGGTTASPVVLNFGAAANVTCQSYVIRGVAASPLGASATSNSTGLSIAAPRVTTTASNSLILYSCGNRTAYPAIPTSPTFSLLGSGYMAQEVAGVSGTDFVATSGTQSPAFDFYGHANSDKSAIALEIKSDGTHIPIQMTSGRTVIDYNAWNDVSHTWYVPNDAAIGVTSILGANMSSANLANTTGNKLSSGGGYFSRRAIYLPSTFVTTWEGKWESVSIDLTNKILCIPWGRSRASDDRVGTNGVICVLADVSGNWKAYQLRSVEDGWVGAVWYTKYIKHGVTPTLDSGGPTTFDIANIRFIGYFHQGTTGVSGGDAYLYLGPVWCEDSPTIFTGGGPTAPINVSSIYSHLNASDLWFNVAKIQGSKQYLGALRHQIGNGSTKTHLKTTGQSFAFRDFDADYMLNAGAVDLRLKGSTDCIFDMSSSIVAGESQQNFAIDSASSTGAELNLVGASFINLNWSADVSVNYSGASFADCNLLELGGGIITNATINSPVGTSGATVSVGGGEINRSTIDSGTNYNLTLGSTVSSITLTDVSFTGTPSIDKIQALKTTGTVIISTAGTTSIALSDITSAGATIDLQVASAALTIAANVSLSGAEIRVYDLDGAGNSLGTELTGTESCPTATFDYAGTGGNSVWIQILKSGYREFGQQFTLPATSSTFTAILIADSNA